MGIIKLKIEIKDKPAIVQAIDVKEDYESFVYTVWGEFLKQQFTKTLMREYLPINEGVWVTFDRLVFMWNIEEEVNKMVQIDELDRDWLMDKVDQELYNTCDYDDEKDGYNQPDSIITLYEKVEELCDLVDSGNLEWLKQEAKFKKCILHLKKGGIDVDCLDTVLNNLKELKQQNDFSSLWFIYQSMNNSSDVFIYLQHY